MEQNFLDATDLKLLDALQHDASRSNLALAYTLMDREDEARRLALKDYSETEAEANIAFYRSVAEHSLYVAR